MSVQQCYISGIANKKNCKTVKAKWRTCPVGGLASVSPIAIIIVAIISIAIIVIRIIIIVIICATADLQQR